MELFDRLAGALPLARIGAVLAILGLAVLASLVSRTLARRRRSQEMCRWEIRPSRDEAASPYQRQKLFDGLHGALSVRWWERPVRGQPQIGLEVHQLPNRTQCLVLVALARHARAIEGALRTIYPDVRLVPTDGHPSWTGHVIRLKKARSFVERIQTAKNDEHLLTEALVTQMAALGELASVQLVLTPAPRRQHAFARSLLKSRERRLRAGEKRSDSDPGMDSVIEDAELKGSLETQHRSLWYAEIRIVSNSRQTARALAGVFSSVQSENRLASREMVLRRRLYRRRVGCAAANPLPSWLRGVLSASELATVWAIPRQQARAARIERAPTRRSVAPPQITRDPAFALMHDELGPVGLLPGDRPYGLQLVGGQGTGKSSVLARSIAIDAADPDCALFVLDVKGDLAKHALGLIPADRTAWYLDLGRPEVGVDLFGSAASPGVKADMLISALKEANEPGAIMAQSDELLRSAAIAIAAVEARPTLWHVYELLSPRRESYREWLVSELRARPGHAAVARYFATTYPEMWRDARSHWAALSAPPRNKINRLLATPGVDKVLRHPCPIDFAEVIARREIVIVNGALDEVGEDNARIVLLLFLCLLHQALVGQLAMPEGERVRVGIKLDDAHRLMSQILSVILALDRAAGAEVAAAFQFYGQIRDSVMRQGALALLRSWAQFATGNAEDAEGHSQLAADVFTSFQRGDPEERGRQRTSPDDVLRLDRHGASCSFLADGARQSPFIAHPWPIQDHANPARADAHFEAMRARGAHYPEVLEPPEGMVPPEASPVPESAQDEPPPVTEITEAPPAREQPLVASDEPAEHPETYRAVHRQGLVGITFDSEPEPGGARPDRPDPTALSILRLLWRCEFMLTSQIRDEFWPGRHATTAGRPLKRMHDAGWVRRFRFGVPRGEGRHEWVYQLSERGFRVAQRHYDDTGPYIPESARYRERTPASHRDVQHTLQTVAWALLYRRLAGPELVAGWIGERQGAVEVPTRLGENRRHAPIEIPDLSLPDHHQIADLRLRRFARVCPDSTFEMRIAGRRFDLMLELDRTERPNKNLDKFLRYDALITAWWRAIPRYQQMAESPAVVFVCPSEELAHAFMREADRIVTGAIGLPGQQRKWSWPGRRRMLFVAEPDIHHGIFRAWALQERPPGFRDQKADLSPRAVELPGAKHAAAAEALAGQTDSPSPAQLSRIGI